MQVTEKTGPGYWNCNTSILDNEQFLQDFNLLVHHLEQFPDKDLVRWENFKISSKELIIKHSKLNSAKEKNHVKHLEQKLKEFSKKPTQFSNEIITIKEELDMYLAHQAEGTKIRAKIEHIEQNTHPSQFFKKLEKQQAKQKTLDILCIDENIITDSNTIKNEIFRYYTQLYSKIDTDPILAHDFTNSLPKITKEDNILLGGPITYEECQEAIRSFLNNKSPGIDGLPKEFYSKLFHIFGKHFVKVINFAYEIQQLLDSQRLGLITLLCKNHDESQLLKNWRPISLLNVDYKIISKVITKKLSKVLHKIIHPDQTSSIPGRSIIDNCHLFRNIMHYIRQKPSNLALISLDQEKAFDHINHSYMFKVLKHFGFSNTFIDWNKLLYTNIHSKLIINQHISTHFPIQKGVRQGCPLSPLLYVIVFETLLTKIRASPNINGLQLLGTNEDTKISAFADDATLI